MADREKLVELLKKTEINKINGHTVLAETCFTPNVFENMATNLIAHGVRLEEKQATSDGWIPVEERLPDDSATVTLCTRSRIVGPGFYDKHTKTWVQYYSGGAIFVDVTHWMPVPQPPKED